MKYGRIRWPRAPGPKLGGHGDATIAEKTTNTTPLFPSNSLGEDDQPSDTASLSVRMCQSGAHTLHACASGTGTAWRRVSHRE